MKRFLLTLACWLAFCIAPGETQEGSMGRLEEMPRPVGSEHFTNGWSGTSGPCGGQR